MRGRHREGKEIGEEGREVKTSRNEGTYLVSSHFVLSLRSLIPSPPLNVLQSSSSVDDTIYLRADDDHSTFETS